MCITKWKMGVFHCLNASSPIGVLHPTLYSRDDGVTKVHIFGKGYSYERHLVCLVTLGHLSRLFFTCCRVCLKHYINDALISSCTSVDPRHPVRSREMSGTSPFILVRWNSTNHARQMVRIVPSTWLHCLVCRYS